VYTVKPNDNASKIAAAFTGDGSRWPELVAANPAKPTKPKGKPDAGNFATLYSGEKLHVPMSWPLNAPSSTTPTPATSTTTPTTPVMAQQSIAYVQTLLAFWVSKHSLEAQGLSQPLYGTVAGDFSGVWDARTSEAMKAFQRWQSIVAGLVATGQPDPASIAALEKVTAADSMGAAAAAAAAGAAAIGGASSGATATTAPVPDEHPANAGASAATAAASSGASPTQTVAAGNAAAAAASSTPPAEQIAATSSGGGGGGGAGPALLGAALLGLSYL
jgi:hypothetical protein